jgi:hypothetical protein
MRNVGVLSHALVLRILLGAMWSVGLYPAQPDGRHRLRPKPTLVYAGGAGETASMVPWPAARARGAQRVSFANQDRGHLPMEGVTNDLRLAT